MNDVKLSSKEFDELCSTHAVRARSRRIYEKALSGATHFEVQKNKLPTCAEFVQDLILENYPDLNVPFHSRWEHFNVGGVNRLALLQEKMKQFGFALKSMEQSVSLADLVIVSVYLDAGAGADWKYRAQDGRDYTRSEGLAVASLEMFESGLFSSDSKNPFRVDSKALIHLDFKTLAAAFQVSNSNPMTGLEGRAQMLQRMGKVLESGNQYFELNSQSRPGNLIFWCSQQNELDAQKLLKSLLMGFSEMWPSRLKLNGVNFGDLWHYPTSSEYSFQNFIPFHKLSQWLAYSLIYPLEELRLPVKNVHEFTGLPEYRNGGLLLDLEVLKVRNPELLIQTHKVDSEFLIEWRALTVHLLDEIASLIRNNLNKTEMELPLGKILQGGTWLAGRKTAQKLRGGLPPFQIQSDGTVF